MTYSWRKVTTRSISDGFNCKPYILLAVLDFLICSIAKISVTWAVLTLKSTVGEKIEKTLKIIAQKWSIDNKSKNIDSISISSWKYVQIVREYNFSPTDGLNSIGCTWVFVPNRIYSLLPFQVLDYNKNTIC